MAGEKRGRRKKKKKIRRNERNVRNREGGGWKKWIGRKKEKEKGD